MPRSLHDGKDDARAMRKHEPSFQPFVAILVIGMVTMALWGGIYGFYLFVRHGWHWLFG